MKPLPPVTSSFTRLTPRHVPDVGARVVPRQPPLVAHRGLRREVEIGEVDDPSGCLSDISHAMGDAGWDAQEPRRAVAQHEPPSSANRLSSTSSTPSMAGADPYDWTWKARLACGVRSIGSASILRLRLDQAQQVLAVGVVPHRLRDGHDIVRRDVPHAVRDLL